METKGGFHFEIIINVLALSDLFEWLCYGSTANARHYKYVYSYHAGIDFSRQILMSEVNPRAVRVNVGPSSQKEVRYWDTKGMNEQFTQC